MATRKAAAPAVKPRAKPGPKPKVETEVEKVAEHVAAPAMPTATPKAFEFEMGEEVTISASNEVGMVRGRAEWISGNRSYFVAYTSSRGEFREAWIDFDLLTGAL